VTPRRKVCGETFAGSPNATVPFGVGSTQEFRGVGSDLWASGREPDGSYTDVRAEVKGISGSNPWAAVVTESEVIAAGTDADTGQWWLLIVTDALNENRTSWWLHEMKRRGLPRSRTVPVGGRPTDERRPRW